MKFMAKKSVALKLNAPLIALDTAAAIDVDILNGTMALLTGTVLCSSLNTTGPMLKACVADAVFNGTGVSLAGLDVALHNVSDYVISFPTEMPIFESLFHAVGVVGAEIFAPSARFIQRAAMGKLLPLVNGLLQDAIANISTAGTCNVAEAAGRGTQRLPPVPAPTPMPERPVPTNTTDAFVAMLAPTTQRLLHAIFGTTLGPAHVDELVDLVVKIISKNCSVTPSLCKSRGGRIVFEPSTPLAVPACP